jgi:hypothetical protein
MVAGARLLLFGMTLVTAAYAFLGRLQTRRRLARAAQRSGLVARQRLRSIQAPSRTVRG